jgi:hypothetical protein
MCPFATSVPVRPGSLVPTGHSRVLVVCAGFKQVEVTPSPATSTPTFGTLSNCGGAEALVPLVGTFATRTATLATPEGAPARSLYAAP